ncbi:MAG: DUF2156 domain-containing protein [Thermoplasmatota archaeon]
MLDMANIRKVEIGDRDLFRDHYAKYPVEHSDYLHAVMCSWQHYMTYKYADVEGSLVIIGEHDGIHYPRPPVGPMSEDLIRGVIEFSVNQDWETKLTMIGERTADFIRKELPDLNLVPHREYFDYIYLSRDLADLPGKQYLKVRNYLNKFRKTYDHSVEPIVLENKTEVREFLIRWCEQKGCDEEPFLLQERQATMFAIDNFFDLGLEGCVIRVDGRVEALSIFEPMTDDTAVIHFEKANFDITGLYQAINNEAARLLAPRFSFINRESDMGVEGLRKAKEKYRPDHMLKVYYIE